MTKNYVSFKRLGSAGTPKPPQARKRKQPPPPPLNPQADWDTWDGDADCRLVELKSNPKLRPNWIFVARRAGYSVEQCQARWKELKDLQKLQDNKPPESTSPAADPEQMTPPPPPPSFSLLSEPHLTHSYITGQHTTNITGRLLTLSNNDPSIHT